MMKERELGKTTLSSNGRQKFRGIIWPNSVSITEKNVFRTIT